MPGRLKPIARTPRRLFDHERRLLERIPLPRMFHTDLHMGVAIPIAIAIIVFGVILLAPRRMCACGGSASKVELAKRLVDAVAAAAADDATYSGRCPTSAQIDSEGVATTDPWGRHLRITCTDAGTKATSAGEDGELDTADDIEAVRR